MAPPAGRGPSTARASRVSLGQVSRKLRPAPPPLEANDQLVTAVITAAWAIGADHRAGAARRPAARRTAGGSGPARSGCAWACSGCGTCPGSSGPGPAAAERRAQAGGLSGPSCDPGARRRSPRPRRRACPPGRSRVRRRPAERLLRGRRGHRLGMRAAAVVERHHPAVVGRVLVRADAEHPAQRAAEPDEEPAGRAGRRGGVASGVRGRARWCTSAARSRPGRSPTAPGPGRPVPDASP